MQLVYDFDFLSYKNVASYLYSTYTTDVVPINIQSLIFILSNSPKQFMNDSETEALHAPICIAVAVLYSAAARVSCRSDL